MTCVIGCRCDDGRIVIVSDAAIGTSDGYRRTMPEGKWWDMGCLVIGEAGSDFALSRIRQKTLELYKKDWKTLKDPYAFSELVCEVQADIQGDEKIEPIDAELLHVAAQKDPATKEEISTIHVIGGDGGITGPFPYTAVGHGATVALPLLDFAAKRDPRMKKRSVVKVTNVLLDIMLLTARYADSVCEPFYTKVYVPGAKFKEL